MSELAKRRAERDLWISRGHVVAALVGAFVVSLGSFGVGFLLGRDGDDARRPVVAMAYGSQVPGKDLVELLARVEANRSPHGGVEALTFPDALAGMEPMQGPMAPEDEPLVAPMDAFADPNVDAPDVAPPPVGTHTLRVASFADRAEAEAAVSSFADLPDLSAWIGAEVVDGDSVFVVALGGFANEDAARSALDGLTAIGRIPHATVMPMPAMSPPPQSVTGSVDAALERVMVEVPAPGEPLPEPSLAPPDVAP